MITAELAQYPSEPHYPRRKRVTASLDLRRQKVDKGLALIIGEARASRSGSLRFYCT